MVYSRRAGTIPAGGQGAGDQEAPHGGGRALSVAAVGQTQIAGGHWRHRGQRRSAGLRCLHRRWRLWRHSDADVLSFTAILGDHWERRDKEFVTDWNWYVADHRNSHIPQESSYNSISILYKAEHLTWDNKTEFTTETQHLTFVTTKLHIQCK